MSFLLSSLIGLRCIVVPLGTSLALWGPPVKYIQIFPGRSNFLHVQCSPGVTPGISTVSFSPICVGSRFYVRPWFSASGGTCRVRKIQIGNRFVIGKRRRVSVQ